MVKRVFAILLTAVLILGLSACFGVGTPGTPDSSASVNTPGEEKTQKEETAQAVPSKEASSETAEKGSETVPSENTGTEEHKQDKVRLVLIDNDSCRLEWVSFRIEGNGDNVFEFRFENKTPDTQLQWGCKASTTVNINEDNVLVNGYLIRSWSSCNELYGNAAPGESKDRSIIISAKDLKVLGMKTVDRLDLPFGVQVSGAHATDPYIVEERFALYPGGMDEASFTAPERMPAEGDRVIVDQDGYKYVMIGADENAEAIIYEEPCYSIYVYVQNDTDKMLLFNDDDCSVNGKDLNEVFTFSTEYVPPRSKNLFSISIKKSLLDYLGITELNEFAYTLYGHTYRRGEGWDHPVEDRVTVDLTKLRKLD